MKNLTKILLATFVALLTANSSYAVRVSLSFNGIADSFAQAGTLGHDGSLSASTPITASVSFDVPESYTIYEYGTYRTIIIPNAVDFFFSAGNYSVSSKVALRVIEFLTADQVRFDLHYDIVPSTFTGTFFENGVPLTDYSRFSASNDLDMGIWFRQPDATLENVWNYLIKGELSSTRFWTPINLDGSFANSIRYMENNYAYSDGGGWLFTVESESVPDSGQTFALLGLACSLLVLFRRKVSR